jgi:hypothetical protein
MMKICSPCLRNICCLLGEAVAMADGVLFSTLLFVKFFLMCNILNLMRTCSFCGIKVQFENLTKTSKFLEKFRIIPVIQIQLCKQYGKVSFRFDKWFEITVDLNTHLQNLTKNSKFPEKLK